MNIEIKTIVRACTYGRGIWQTFEPEGSCVPIAFIFPNPLEGYQYYEASDIISINTTVSGGLGTDVYLKAANYINFTDGVEAKDNGTELKAYINDCGIGIPFRRKDVIEEKK